MDLVEIMLDAVLETAINMINAMINIIFKVLEKSSDFSGTTLFDGKVEALMDQANAIAIALVGSFVLVQIFKKLINDDDIAMTSSLLRMLYALVMIKMTPIMIKYFEQKVPSIIRQLSGSVAITDPDISKMDVTGFVVGLASLNKITKSFLVIFLFVVIVALIAMIILFLQSLVFRALIGIAKIVSPIMALGVISPNSQLYAIFLKDVAGIYITRILQLTLLKLSFVMVIGAFVDQFADLLQSDGSIASIADASLSAFLNVTTGTTLMITLMFLPSFIKKYTTSSGVGGMIKTTMSSAALIAKGAAGGGA